MGNHREHLLKLFDTRRTPFSCNVKNFKIMETSRIQTRSGRFNPEQLARKFEQLAQQIRQSKTISGTVQTTPYGTILSIAGNETVLTLSTQKGGAL